MLPFEQLQGLRRRSHPKNSVGNRLEAFHGGRFGQKNIGAGWLSRHTLIQVFETEDRLPNTAVDIFFDFLARDQGDKAVGIILSGSGTDGSRGIEAIKGQNGLVIIQDPITAAFDGMPGSAISSGFANMILPPDMIGEEMITYLRDEPAGKSLPKLLPSEEAIMQQILVLIQQITRHDFGHYKRPILYQRMAKRMAEIGMATRSRLTFSNRNASAGIA